MTQEVKEETPHAWAKITKSSSKDGGIGYEFGYSASTGDLEEVGTALAVLKGKVLKIVESM